MFVFMPTLIQLLGRDSKTPFYLLVTSVLIFLYPVREVVDCHVAEEYSLCTPVCVWWSCHHLV